MNTKSKHNRMHRLKARDGVNCHICSLPMSFKAVDGGLNISASIDHISKNNKYDPDYQKLAHRWCNSRRANDGITPELVVLCRTQIELDLVKYKSQFHHLKIYAHPAH